MYRIVSSPRVRRGFILLAILSATAALVLFPKTSVSAARDGLTLCCNVIIPSLFPFFVMSSLIVELGFAERIGRLFQKLMRPLFNVGGVAATALVLGFIGGYPVGAKTAIALYKNGSVTKSEAERLLSFCNNSGPAFILGVVGAGIFSSSAVGLLLYVTHMLSSILVGIAFRGWGKKSARTDAACARVRTVNFTNAFTSSVTGSFGSTLNICAFVIFFTVFIKLLFAAGIIPWLATLLAAVFGPLGLDAAWSERLITGAIELTSGVWSLQPVAGQLGKAITMAAFMLGWAGLSVHCQVLSFIGGSGLSVGSYILGKLLHGVISAGVVTAMGLLFPFKAPVASYLAQQVAGIAAMDFSASLMISTILAFAVFLFALILSLVFGKKSMAQTVKARYNR